MKKDVGVAAIIRDASGACLLNLRDEFTPRHPNQWYLVGGHPEGAETPRQAIVREVKEETGFTLRRIKLFKTLRMSPAEVHIFEGVVNRESEQMILGEGKELRFFNRQNLKIFFNNLSYTNEYLEVLKVFLQEQP